MISLKEYITGLQKISTLNVHDRIEVKARNEMFELTQDERECLEGKLVDHIENLDDETLIYLASERGVIL